MVTNTPNISQFAIFPPDAFSYVFFFRVLRSALLWCIAGKHTRSTCYFFTVSWHFHLL